MGLFGNNHFHVFIFKKITTMQRQNKYQINDIINFSCYLKPYGDIKCFYIGQIREIKRNGFILKILFGDESEFINRNHFFIGFKSMINFSLPHCFINNFLKQNRSEKFRQLLAGKFKNLIFRRVSFVLSGGSFGEYFGFTRKRALENNDIYYGRRIFFNNKHYSTFNLSCGKLKLKRRKDSCNPPTLGRLVCGNVIHGEKDLFFNNWFICSFPFYNLWKLIQYGPDNQNMYNKIEKVDQNIKKKYNLENDCETDIYEKIASIILNKNLDKNNLGNYFINILIYKITCERNSDDIFDFLI